MSSPTHKQTACSRLMHHFGLPLLCPSFCNSAIIRVRLPARKPYLPGQNVRARLRLLPCFHSLEACASRLEVGSFSLTVVFTCTRGSVGRHPQAAKSISVCIKSRVHVFTCDWPIVSFINWFSFSDRLSFFSHTRCHVKTHSDATMSSTGSLGNCCLM